MSEQREDAPDDGEWMGRERGWSLLEMRVVLINAQALHSFISKSHKPLQEAHPLLALFKCLHAWDGRTYTHVGRGLRL